MKDDRTWWNRESKREESRKFVNMKAKNVQKSKEDEKLKQWELWEKC